MFDVRAEGMQSEMVHNLLQYSLLCSNIKKLLKWLALRDSQNAAWNYKTDGCETMNIWQTKIKNYQIRDNIAR